MNRELTLECMSAVMALIGHVESEKSLSVAELDNFAIKRHNDFLDRLKTLCLKLHDHALRSKVA